MFSAHKQGVSEAAHLKKQGLRARSKRSVTAEGTRVRCLAPEAFGNSLLYPQLGMVDVFSPRRTLSQLTRLRRFEGAQVFGFAWFRITASAQPSSLRG